MCLLEGGDRINRLRYFFHNCQSIKYYRFTEKRQLDNKNPLCAMKSITHPFGAVDAHPLGAVERRPQPPQQRGLLRTGAPCPHRIIVLPTIRLKVPVTICRSERDDERNERRLTPYGNSGKHAYKKRTFYARLLRSWEFIVPCITRMPFRRRYDVCKPHT